MSRPLYPALLALLAGCSLFFPVRQDPETLWALQELRSSIRGLYETFKGATVDPTQVRDQWDVLSARERGKGEANSLMQDQVRRCREMFESHLRNRLEGGPWTLPHHDNQLENMLEAIDLAIRTERSKAQ